MRLLLARALSYVHRSHVDPTRVISFRRGVPISDLHPIDYEFLMARGGFVDPDREIDFVPPKMLRAVSRGTEVPIVRTGGMGDVLFVTIGLREIAKDYPHLRFVYGTSRRYLPILRDLDFCRVTALEDLRGRFQWGVDLRGYSERNGNERHYRIDVFSKYLTGHIPTDYRYPVRRREEERLRGEELLGGADDRPILGITARAAGQVARSWPLAYQAELAMMAARAGWRTVLLDDARTDLPPGMVDAGTLNLTGTLDCQGLMDVLQALDALVSPDTGTLHLGEALEVPTVAVMSTVEPDARLRHYRWTRALWAGLPCSPCYHQVCDWASPKPCVRAVTPQAVWREVEFVASHDPPWPLEVPADPAPVDFPRRPPLKTVVFNRAQAAA